MTASLWIANRQIFEILAAELAALRPAFDAVLPRQPDLEAGLRDLTGLASAGLVETLAWAFVADHGPAGGGPPYLLAGACYRPIQGPPPTPLDRPLAVEPIFEAAELRLLFRPSQRFEDLPRAQREGWLGNAALPWRPAAAPSFTLVRPFRLNAVWSLADGGSLLREVSHVGGR